jgi:transcriptional regulator with XRE-family HTH domain
MTVGERLLKLRKEKNMSQEDLANVLDVSRQTVSKWETGESMPDFNKICPLCEYFGITSDELLSTRVVLETPDGSYFSQTEDVNEKRIEAKIKVSGKVQEDISNVKFYWFKENSSIDLISPKYNHAGGAGWEYLTEGTNTYIVHKTDIVSEEQMYKCVADIGGILYSQVVIFKN